MRKSIATPEVKKRAKFDASKWAIVKSAIHTVGRVALIDEVI
jgi:hypothetical protein